MGKYDPLVDILGHKQIGGKTILYMIDGLYAGSSWGAIPTKWQIAPFNNDWPSSVFVSQDPVAIDSVGIDFLRAQMALKKTMLITICTKRPRQTVHRQELFMTLRLMVSGLQASAAMSTGTMQLIKNTHGISKPATALN